MKYEVGQKVRVRKDLEIGNVYGKIPLSENMTRLCGKVVTIKGLNGEWRTYKFKEDEYGYNYAEEMLEPITTNWDKLKEISAGEFAGIGFCNVINIMRKKTNCLGMPCKECREWLDQPYGEFEGEILDEVEKKYLENVIKPFRNKVKSISKETDQKGEFIRIKIINDTAICFPYFKEGTMYKGMNPNVTYTLEELGL